MQISRNVSLILISIVAINAVTFADVLLRPSAIGKGVMPGKTNISRSEERQFSFSVQSNPDGTISGQAVLVSPESDGAVAGEPYTLELEITCMNVVGNVAFFGGTTTKTSDPDLVDAAYFSVQDNGIGIDKISRVYFFDDDPNTTGDPHSCMENRPGDFPMEPIASGNINVRQ